MVTIKEDREKTPTETGEGRYQHEAGGKEAASHQLGEIGPRMCAPCRCYSLAHCLSF